MDFKFLFDENIEVIEYEDLRKFLRTIKGKENILDIAKQFTDDIPSLFLLLITIMKSIKRSRLKARLKRTIIKLRNQCTSENISISGFEDDNISVFSSQGNLTDDSEKQFF